MPVGHKILIVDDDVLIREVIRESLQGEGYRILEAADGSEAVDLAERESPDLIIMDIVMRRMDGITACKLIREADWGHLIPIVILTSLEDDESIRHAELAGATDILIKPLQTGLLKHRIRFLIKSNKTFAQTSLTPVQLNELLEALPDPLIIYGSDLRIAWANRRAEEYFDAPVSSIVGHKCSSFCPDADQGKCHVCLFEMSYRRQQEYSGFNRMGGDTLWLERTFLLNGGSGSEQKIVKICHAITEKSGSLENVECQGTGPDRLKRAAGQQLAKLGGA